MPDNIEIINQQPIIQIIDKTPNINLISVGIQGPVGPQGPIGPPGAGSQYIKWIYSTQTGNYSVNFVTDTVIAVDSSTHPVSITLPISSSVAGPGFNQGYGVWIKSTNYSPTYFPILILPQGGQLIDTSSSLMSSYTFISGEGALFLSTGSGYAIMADSIATPSRLSAFYAFYISV